MPWLILVLASSFEIAWAVGLKYTDGFTRPWPTIATVLAMLASVATLAQAMKSLPVGTAYAAWSGLGAVGTIVFGIAFFGESAALPRLLCVALILAGVLGLKLVA